MNLNMDYRNDIGFALSADASDPLYKFRKEFLFPQQKGKEVIYFTGNSLGLQPVSVKQALISELNDWEKYGVEGHFKAKNPWFSYHEMFKEPLSHLVGALPHEVTVMNGLTVNLHLLMVSFYRPQGKRTKILCEAKPFPSDYYAIESQLKFHGLNTKEHLIEVQPGEGEHTIKHEEILRAIEKNKNELALVFIGGVNYYTGQVFNIKEITQAAHKAGAYAGFDLAHAAGNIQLNLHEWNVDFAAWCSYKYLNSGPGSVSGIFVHEKFANNKELPRFAGWWGYPANKRFLMEPGFTPAFGADGWQLSNAAVFAMAPHKVALEVFAKAGFDALCEKSHRLTGYLEYIIDTVCAENKNAHLQIITPRNISERGCQLSVLTGNNGKKIFDYLSNNGVIADWREPNVIRLAPVPLYNSFEDVFVFGQLLNNALKNF